MPEPHSYLSFGAMISGQILNRVRDVDASDSEAVKEVLNAFFQNLLKYKDIDCNRWLRALENVINRYVTSGRTAHAASICKVSENKSELE